MSSNTPDLSPKIVFVNRYFFPDQSATSRMLSDLAFRLVERGIPVAVVTSRQLYDNPRAALLPREVVAGVRIHRLNTATLGRKRLAGRALDYASFHFAAAAELLKMLRAHDVVVAKTDPPLISILVSHVARWRRATLVNWLQDLFPEVASALTPGLLPSWLESLLVGARNRSLRRAASNVVLSAGMRERVLSCGIESGGIRIIPNWADPMVITPMPSERSTTRQRLKLLGRFVVGYSGNLGRAHEFHTLIGTARALRDDCRFVFLVTGAGAKAGGLREMVEREKLSNCIFQDYQPAELLSDSLAASDVHLVSLLPALEGLIVPSKIYGILAAGRPALFIGDTGGDVARLVRDHDCGMAVHVGDSESLAACLRVWCDDPRRVETMGKNARRLALAHFTSEHAVESWLSLLEFIAPSVVFPVSAGGEVDRVVPAARNAR